MKTLVDEIKRRTLQDAGLTEGTDPQSISAECGRADHLELYRDKCGEQPISRRPV